MAYDDEPFNYSKSEATDPVARLLKRIEKGDVRLQHEAQHGYLLSLLKELGIATSSQTLVFSKTSLHRDLISPDSPRAIYFNDDVYVGWVRGAPVLEISASDPAKGGMFYVLSQTASEQARPVRNQSCLECHVSRFSMGVPGHLIRSVETDNRGFTGDITGGSRVSHSTPYQERRGGWYVTGIHGPQPHLGNLVGHDDFERHLREPQFGGNLTNLSALFDTSLCVTPHSDVVALMVLEHQAHMHNYIARLNYEATLRLHQYGHIRYTEKIADSFLRYLLFAEEVPLTYPVQGTSTFAHDFQALGPRDKNGRSLRDLDLQTRLFKYPCSYLISSEAFRNLPKEMLDYLYSQLWKILTDQDDSGDFDHLRRATRRAIVEILVETQPGLPGYWTLDNYRASL